MRDIIHRAPAIARLGTCTIAGLLVCACGGGGGGGAASQKDLTVAFRYVPQADGYDALTPLSVQPDLSGLSNEAPACVLTSGRLPAGVSVVGSSCALEGTPLETGRFDFSVRLTVSGYTGHVDASGQLTIKGPSFTYGFFYDGIPWGEAFNSGEPSWGSFPSAAQVRYRLDTGTAPEGLQIDPITGAISGTPIGDPGSYDIKASADITYEGHTLVAEHSTVDPLIVQSPQVFYATEADGRVGQLMSFGPTTMSTEVFTANGFTLSYVYDAQQSSCAMPQGLGLDAASGIVSGTPVRAEGICNIAIRWTANKSGREFTGYRPIQLTIR